MNESISVKLDETLTMGNLEINVHAINMDRGILLITNTDKEDRLINVMHGDNIPLPGHQAHIKVVSVGNGTIILQLAEGAMH